MSELVVALMIVIVIQLFALNHSLNSVAQRLSEISANPIQHSFDSRLEQIATSLSLIEDSIGRLEDRFIPYDPEQGPE